LKKRGRVEVQTTANFEAVRSAFDAGKDGICLEGSSRSGKTRSVCQWICHYALSQKTPKTVTIGRDWLATLKKTVWEDMLWAAENFGFEVSQRTYNKSEMQLMLGKVTVRGVGILDNIQKFHGMSQDVFFGNEVMTLHRSTYNQLRQRTKHFFILDYNPSENEHWVYTLPADERIAFYRSTYRGNPFLSPQIIRQIESYDPENPENVRLGTANEFYHKVYALGLRAASERQIFRNLTQTTQWPEEFDDEVFGLDFGFSHDPAAVVHVRRCGHSLYLKEVFYQSHTTNQELADRIGQYLKDRVCMADSAEMKSITDLRNYGLDVLPAKKGQGSVLYGIQKLQSFRIFIYFEPNCNIWREFTGYKWQIDKAGAILKDVSGRSVPIDTDNHLIDATRYAITLWA
jgi:phage terminase large subunit